MEYTELGKTGLRPSVVSFGGIPIQRGSAGDAKAVLEKCRELGINYIDTARGYTVSESYIGEALQGMRDSFILATKSMSRDYGAMKADIETSLKNLKTDFIELYQVHNIKQAQLEALLGENGAYRALEEAKAAGKIGGIGVTIHSEDTLRTVVEEHSDKFETIMFPYNLVETQGVEELKRAKSLGMGTIAMKPFAGGNLKNSALALRFIAAGGVMDISIPGMGSLWEVEANASVSFGELTEEELAEIERIREELGTRFCRRCGYCAPCTAGISIPDCFTFFNYKKNYGLDDWSEGRYKSMSAHAGDCIGCGACESRCPYDLPIRDMLKEVAGIFGF